MLTTIYFCGFAVVLCATVIGYDYTILRMVGRKQTHPLWVYDLIGAFIVTFWPILIPGFIKGFRIYFSERQKRRRVKDG